MMHSRKLTPLFLLIAITGCTTLRVSKVSFDETTGAPKKRPDGVLYSLPKPILKVEPKADGTIDVNVEYLPDRDHTYVISADSKFASHDLTVDVEKGLLKKVVWGPDSTGVASKALDVFAATEKARLEAAQAQQEKAEAKAAESLKNKEMALDSAKKALEAAELELSLKRAELLFLLDQPPSSANDEKITAARLAIAVAEARVESLREKVSQAQDAYDMEKRNSFALLGASQADSSGSTAPGPIFYSIVEKPGESGRSPSVSLVAIDFERDKKQGDFETTTIQKIPTPSEPRLVPRRGIDPTVPFTATQAYRLAEKGVEYAKVRLRILQASGGSSEEIRKAEASLAVAEAEFEFEKQEAYWVEVDSNVPIKQLGRLGDERPCFLTPVQPSSLKPPHCELVTSTSVLAKLPTALQEGKYTLTLNFRFCSNGQRQCSQPKSRAQKIMINARKVEE